MKSASAAVFGCRNFEGRRLNVLQIGLGTFATFVHNLTGQGEMYTDIEWLMSAASTNSTDLLAVGVEPIQEHVKSLVTALQSLPNASLVQAAIGRRDINTSVHSLHPTWKHLMQRLDPKEQESFYESVLFLLNMSSVGWPLPWFKECRNDIEQQHGVRLDLQKHEVRCFSYSGLVQLLNFSGTEVLIIDTEGQDCQILLSMIDTCSQHDDPESAWPDVIQFESMGHCDEVDGGGAEASICQMLKQNGYVLACSGKDTQLVKGRVLQESRIDRWVQTFQCTRCFAKGFCGMPFKWHSWTMLCRSCQNLYSVFGS